MYKNDETKRLTLQPWMRPQHAHGRDICVDFPGVSDRRACPRQLETPEAGAGEVQGIRQTRVNGQIPAAPTPPRLRALRKRGNGARLEQAVGLLVELEAHRCR